MPEAVVLLVLAAHPALDDFKWVVLQVRPQAGRHECNSWPEMHHKC